MPPPLDRRRPLRVGQGRPRSVGRSHALDGGYAQGRSCHWGVAPPNRRVGGPVPPPSIPARRPELPIPLRLGLGGGRQVQKGPPSSRPCPHLRGLLLLVPPANAHPRAHHVINLLGHLVKLLGVPTLEARRTAAHRFTEPAVRGVIRGHKVLLKHHVVDARPPRALPYVRKPPLEAALVTFRVGARHEDDDVRRKVHRLRDEFHGGPLQRLHLARRGPPVVFAQPGPLLLAPHVDPRVFQAPDHPLHMIRHRPGGEACHDVAPVARALGHGEEAHLKVEGPCEEEYDVERHLPGRLHVRPLHLVSEVLHDLDESLRVHLLLGVVMVRKVRDRHEGALIDLLDLVLVAPGDLQERLEGAEPHD
mmetsp:Transcript_38928/g.99449  ORF Transcript_38928/g.99449 Transcript_38928/m.99449 type:complete len:362 (-) Transcript_38928:85-1170(-)